MVLVPNLMCATVERDTLDMLAKIAFHCLDAFREPADRPTNVTAMKDGKACFAQKLFAKKDAIPIQGFVICLDNANAILAGNLRIALNVLSYLGAFMDIAIVLWSAFVKTVGPESFAIHPFARKNATRSMVHATYLENAFAVVAIKVSCAMNAVLIQDASMEHVMNHGLAIASQVGKEHNATYPDKKDVSFHQETAMISITEEATINTKEDVSSFMFRLHFTLEPTSRLCKE